MPRKRFEWKIRDKVLQLGDRTLIMGVLNVTPDSFSDGGKYLDPDRAYARAIELEDAGADILDIGAESTKPGSARISEAEELRRLVPVLKRLKGAIGIPISVDTYKAAVAEKALELGADIINDPSGLTFDSELARVISNANAGVILCHMRGTPETWAKMAPLKNAIQTIAQELDAAVHRAIATGLDRKRVVIDPGLGFGKRKEQNAEVIAFLEALARLEVPIMVGASRKHFLSKDNPDQTEFATAAAVTASILHGAHLVRVHDVAAMKAVAETADEIYRAGLSRGEAEETAVFRVPRANPEPERKAVRPPGPVRKEPIRRPALIENVVAEPEKREVEPVQAEPTAPPREESAPKPPFQKRAFPEKRSFDSDRGRDDQRPPRPFRRPDGPPGSKPSGPSRKDFGKRPFSDKRASGPDRGGDDRRPPRPFRRPDGPPGSRPSGPPRKDFGKKPYSDKGASGPDRGGDDRRPPRPFRRPDGPPGSRPSGPPRRDYGGKPPFADKRGPGSDRRGDDRKPFRPTRRPDGPPGSRPSGPPRGPRKPR